jgi:hypothetical protein
VETSQDHSTINYLRVALTGVSILLALIGFIGIKGEKRITRINLSVIAIAIPPILLFPLFVYSGEFIIRVFLIMLFPITYFASTMMFRRVTAVVLTAIIIIMIPLHMVTHYGNELIERVPITEEEFSEFFFSHTSGGRVIAQIPPALFQRIEKYSQFAAYSSIPDDEYGRKRLEAARVIAPEYPIIYFEVCQRLYDVYKYSWNNTTIVQEYEEWAKDWPGYNLVYSNGDVKLYSWMQ